MTFNQLHFGNNVSNQALHLVAVLVKKIDYSEQIDYRNHYLIPKSVIDLLSYAEPMKSYDVKGRNSVMPVLVSRWDSWNWSIKKGRVGNTLNIIT